MGDSQAEGQGCWAEEETPACMPTAWSVPDPGTQALAAEMNLTPGLYGLALSSTSPGRWPLVSSSWGSLGGTCCPPLHPHQQVPLLALGCWEAPLAPHLRSGARLEAESRPGAHVGDQHPWSQVSASDGPCTQVFQLGLTPLLEASQMNPCPAGALLQLSGS